MKDRPTTTRAGVVAVVIAIAASLTLHVATAATAERSGRSHEIAISDGTSNT